MKKSIDNQSRGLSEEHGVSNTDHADLTFYERLCKSARTPSAEKMTHENIKPFFSDDSLSDKEVVTNLINHYKSESSSSSPFSWLKVMGQQYFFGENAPSTIPPSFRFDLAVVLSLHISGEIDLLKEFPQKSFACMEGLAGKMGEAISSHYGTPEGKLLNAYLSEVSRDLVEKGYIHAGNEIHALTGLKYIFGLVSENEAKQMDPSYRLIFNLSPNITLPLMGSFYNDVLPHMVSETEKTIREELAPFKGMFLDKKAADTLLSIEATHPWLKGKISEIVDIDNDGFGVPLEREFVACIPQYPAVQLPHYDALINSKKALEALSPFEKRTMLHVLRTLGEDATGTAPILQKALFESLSEENRAPHYLPTMRADIGSIPHENASYLYKIIAGASIGALEEKMEISYINEHFSRILSKTLAERSDLANIYDKMTWSNPNSVFFSELLTAAITYNNMPLLERALKDAQPISIAATAAGILWQSPLHLACQLNHTKALDLLLENEGVALDHVNENDATPLMIACEMGHEKVVVKLLAEGAEIDKADTDGWTPLMFACYKNHATVVAKLLANGAEINATDTDGWTPLMMACRNGHEEMATTLLANGAEIDKARPNGWTPLMIACEMGHEKVVAKLLARRAEIDKARPNGWTPLMIACRNGYTEVVAMLLANGAEINATDTDGATPLMIACEMGHEKVVVKLLAEEAKIDKADTDGWTPLMMACRNGHTEVVAMLLEKGAEVDKANKFGTTPLYITCEEGHATVVAILLANGAKMDKTNTDGWTPLFIAHYNGNTAVEKMLLEKEEECSLVSSEQKRKLDDAGEWERRVKTKGTDETERCCMNS